MKSLKVFEDEYEKDEYILKMQEYALLKMQEFKEKLWADEKIYNYEKERRIAILSYIAVKPEFIDKQLIERITSLNIKGFYFDIDQGIGGMAEDNNIQIAESNEKNSIYLNNKFFSALCHEMLHTISVNSGKTFSDLSLFLEEGITDNKTEDLLESWQFREICRKEHYNPKLWGAGYGLERAITGVMNLASNGKLEASHTVGDEEINSYLQQNSGFMANESMVDNIEKLLFYRELFNNEKLSDKDFDVLQKRFPYTAFKCFSQFANKLEGMQLSDEQIIKLSRYENDFVDYMKSNAVINELMCLDEEKKLIYNEKINAMLCEIHCYCTPFYAKLDFEPTKKVLQSVESFSTSSKVNTILKQMELLEKSGLTKTDAVANMVYNNLKDAYDSYILIQPIFLKQSKIRQRNLAKNQSTNAPKIDLNKVAITALEQGDRRVIKMISRLRENENFCMVDDIDEKIKKIFELDDNTKNATIDKNRT